MEKALIYDDNCPMCRVYTKGFVKAGLLANEERLSNGQLSNEAIRGRIDPQRARHEIPLVDLSGGETRYGVDALLELLGQKMPLVKQVGTVRWVRFLLIRLYAFISYNRRIVVPTPPDRWELMDFAPQFHASYRLLFLALIFGLVGGLHWLTVGSLAWPVVALLAGQVAATGLYLFFRRTPNGWEHWLDYMGHLGMSLFLGAVLLTFGYRFDWPVMVIAGMALTIGQHFIRTQTMGLSPWVSVGFTAVYLAITLN